MSGYNTQEDVLAPLSIRSPRPHHEGNLGSLSCVSVTLEPSSFLSPSFYTGQTIVPTPPLSIEPSPRSSKKTVRKTKHNTCPVQRLVEAKLSHGPSQVVLVPHSLPSSLQLRAFIRRPSSS